MGELVWVVEHHHLVVLVSTLSTLMFMLMARLIGKLEAGKNKRNLKVLRKWSRHIVKLVSHGRGTR